MRRVGTRLRAVAAALILGLGTSGCAVVPRDAFTAEDEQVAGVPGFAGIRTWADANPAEIARLVAPPRLEPGHDLNYLALSGGGAGGSFASGLLNGWSEGGTRPRFDVVSGVSTGALIAPFAFLGSSYDAQLRTLYTGDAAAGVASFQNVLKIAAGSGLLDPAPLQRLIERYATPDMLDAIATEHRRGRRLLVITTNLDAQRPVVWDLGAVAASGRDDALPLFRQILLASASIPAVYPPVMIDAQAEAKHFTEMHVDGGTSTQVFTLPDMLLGGSRRLGSGERKRIHLWVVVNNTLPPEFLVTGAGTLPIALRSFSTLMKSQTTGIVTAAYEASLRLGIDFNLAYIDQPLAYDPARPFKADYMDAAFALGETQARAGTVWRKSLSGLARPLTRLAATASR